MTKKPNVAFLAADNYYTKCFLKYLAIKYKDDFNKIIALVQQPERVKDLEQYGVHICKVDYNSVESVQKGLSGVDSVLLSNAADEVGADQASTWVKAISNAKTECALLLSCFTADGKTERQKRYRDVEKAIGKLDHHTVIRVGFLHESLFLWSKSITEEGKFKISVNSDAAFAPISMCDVGLVVQKLVLGESKHTTTQATPPHTLKLTGGESLTPPQTVERLNHAIKADVKYEKISREEMKKYLESLRMQSTMIKGDDEWTPPLGDHLSEECIAVVLETLDYINEGNAGDVTNDFERIVDKKPVDIGEFFKKHEKCFKPPSK